MSMISVIIPAYNAEKVISNTINSIIRQNYEDMEIIIVDDGSNDRTPEICDAIAATDARIIVVHQTNSGASNARNRGIQFVHSPYIMFADADDFMDVDYIGKLVNGIETNQADLAIGGIRFIVEREGTIVSESKVDVSGGLYSLRDFLESYPKYMSNAIIGAPWNKVYQTETIKKYKISFDEQLKNNEDIIFNYEYLKHCNLVYLCDGTYYNYFTRVGVQSASKREIDDLFGVYLNTYHQALDFLRVTGTYDENGYFQKCYFIKLVINAIGRIALSNHNKAEKIVAVQNICDNNDVVECAKVAKLNDPKFDVTIKLIKRKKVRSLIALFRISNIKRLIAK